MKTSRLLPFAVLAAACFPARAAANEPLAPRGAHPYFFYTASRIAALKGRSVDERAAAERMSAGRGVENLVLAYRMSGDPRDAAKVRDYLLAQVKKSTWGEPDLLRRSPSWHAGLGLARELSAVAVAFDGVHDALTPGERREIAQGIVDLGILPTLDDWLLPDTRIHALDTMGHNWWSACVFAAGLGAIAVWDEEPRAKAWLERMSEASVEWFGYTGSSLENKPATFDPEGGFYESVNYASFAMSSYLLFRLAWTDAFGRPPAAVPNLDRIGDFLIHASYWNSGPMMTLDFGDGSIHSDGSRPLSLLLANGIRRPQFDWYLDHARTESYREGLDRSTPLGLLLFPTDAELRRAPIRPDLPTSIVYPEMGWAMLRSSWDKDATLLGVKSGYTWNHSHADEGSFILFHHGQSLLIDSGTCSYSRPEYDGYYRQSAAHNVVLFDGQAENPEDTYFGSKFPGTVSQLIDAGDLKYVLADATGPTSHLFVRNYRHFLWIGSVILVIDDVEAFEPGQFSWLLHVGGEARRGGLDLRVANGPAAVLVRPLFPDTFPDAGLPTDYPEKMRLVERIGLKDHDPDSKVTYYAFEPSEKTRRTKFVTAITLLPADGSAPGVTFERLRTQEMIGVRIRQAGSTTDVYLNLLADNRVRHRNANAVLGGWQTDAYLLALSYPPSHPETVRRFFVADGSYLRRGGTVVLDSLSKVFATWTAGAAGREVILRSQPTAQVRLNGRLVPPAGG